jgi:menaquinone-9 beta-reductase
MIKCDYEIAIAGGGVAGLSAAILLSQAGYKTILFEKHKYPFQKVCGEYISLEALEFLKLIGFDPDNYGLPIISKFKLSSGNSVLNTNLTLGGIGVSRYFLDDKLMKFAEDKGADIIESTTISGLQYIKNHFKINTNIGELTANIVLGAFGKRSNLSRGIDKKDNSKNNYIGVKYHVRADLPSDQIELHIFNNGYCGISKVEGKDKYCMCYMTTANNLKNCGNSIEKLEKQVLSKNPFLKRYLNQYEKITEFPVTISQINLGMKEIIHNNIMMIGDAAGTIAPLCGNGMSLAFHSSYRASQYINQYLQGLIPYKEALEKYHTYWKKNFYKRIYSGNYLQKLFLNEKAASIAIVLLKHTHFLHAPLIRLTHGKDFVTNGHVGMPVR